MANISTNKISIVLAAGSPAAGVSAASAAGMYLSDAKMAPRARDSLVLSTTQQKTAWNDLHAQAGRQTAPSGFRANIGQVIPNGVTVKPVPSKTASDLPSLRRYDFALVKGKLLIVNPADKKIVEVISG